jgi:glucose/arabinose dehydrogenase
MRACIGGSSSLLEGAAAYGDWRSDAPGVRRRIRASDLPAPYATNPTANIPAVIGKPPDARLNVPLGFQVRLLASNLDQPRLIRVAPNGDIFIAESGAGRVRVLRPTDTGGEVSLNEIFATGLNRPFGIAFFPNGDNPQWVYVANTDSVVRFRYRNGDLKASTEPEVVVPILPHGGSHESRDLAFSLDNTKMFVSVGSASNAAESTFKFSSPRQWVRFLRRWIKQGLFAGDDEFERADVLVFNPNGGGRRIYASGIRNCVGMAVNSETGDLWCSTNERDGLGDNLPPDYITRVREGGFYGWPWYYIGTHEDPPRVGAPSRYMKRTGITPPMLRLGICSKMRLAYPTRRSPACAMHCWACSKIDRCGPDGGLCRRLFGRRR